MKTSELEEALAFQIKALSLPPPLREYKFDPKRRYRFDFAWPLFKVACEVQGGIWKRSGHTTGTGIERDCEKLNLALLGGWRVVLATSSTIKSGVAVSYLEALL